MTNTDAPTRKGRIILTRGIPASGKSTWAREWVAEDPDNRIRLNRDDLRRMTRNAGGKYDYNAERVITAAQHAAARAAIRSGIDVVVDDTNLNNRFVKEWFKIGPIEFKDFEVDPDVAYARDAQREHPVGPEVIAYFRDKFRIPASGALPAPPQPKTLPADVEFEKYVPDESKQSAWIFDVDGTLAHIVGDDPRSPYDESRAHEDEADEAVLSVLLALERKDFIIVVSGRKSTGRDVTTEWFRKNGVPYDEFYMRDSDDERPDTVVKYEIFEQHIRNRYAVRGVFDDRNSVVAMWRAIGLKCFHVQPGDF